MEPPAYIKKLSGIFFYISFLYFQPSVYAGVNQNIFQIFCYLTIAWLLSAASGVRFISCESHP